MKIIISIIVILSLFNFAHSSYFLRVDDRNHLLKDKDQRYRIYHGVNVVFQLAPFYPPIRDHFHVNDSFSSEDARLLQNWGMNVIRLYVAWEGIEPERGQFNETYIEQLRGIVRLAAEYNISVLLDAHQDLLSRRFCGQGAPDWAMVDNDFPKPLKYKIRKDDRGNPLWEDCLKHEFGTYYFSKAVTNNWERLFKNVDGIADEFAQTWGLVVRKLKDEPNIIGYEIINEPFGSSVYHKPYQVPWDSNIYLLPFYKKINAEIRKWDNDTLVFFETSLTDMVFPTGFKTNLGGPLFRDREVLSYHVYCPTVNKVGEPKNGKVCSVLDSYFFLTKVREIRHLKIGAFLTEFGALNNSTKSAQEIARVTQQAEQRFHSWTYWQYKYYSDITTAARPGTTESFWDIYGFMNTQKIKALSRPYAYAICGKPLQTSFNPNSASFKFSYKAFKYCNDKQTEIYLSNDFYYPNGYNLQCNVGCRLTQIANMKGYYVVDFNQDFVDGKKVIINVTPK